MNKIKNMVNAAMKKANLDRFSLAQMTSNSDGKTSGSGTMGVLTITVGLLTFIMGAVHDLALGGTGSIMTQSIIVISLGTGLLGYRKSKDGMVTKDAVTPPHDEFHPEPGDDKPLNS